MSLDVITLPDGRAKTTVVGFGCSALIGGRTRAESRRLLDAAFDAGVRHFDVARLYGTGDAESVLGQFARARQGQVTIATKFGIDPLPNTAVVGAAKTVLRPLMRRSRTLLRVARRNARHAVRSGRFSVEHAQRSLAASLERLGADQVDVLLLHGCTVNDWLADDLRETLGALVDSGKIRFYGTATSFETTRAFLDSAGPLPKVLQFESDAINRNVDRISDRLNGSTAVTFSCLSAALPLIRARLAADDHMATVWTRALDVDVTSADDLSSLLLASAVRSNRQGITLFSAGSPSRIATNVSGLAERLYDDRQLNIFTELVQALAESRTGSHDG